ncbi:MAG: hypothetical protein ACAI44_17920 [Candidatus Sericytochromatia bacterium]
MTILEELKQLPSRHPGYLHADSLFQSGVADLEAYQESNLERFELLEQASSVLQESHHLNPQDERPCLALSLLFLLLDDPIAAEKYFALARELCPANPLLPAFEQMLVKAIFGQSEAIMLKPVPELLSQSDPALRYAELGRLLDELLDRVLAHPVPRPEPFYSQIEILQLELSQLEEYWRFFTQELAGLAGNIDVSNLNQQLRPLEIFLERYRRNLAASQELSELKQSMTRQMQLAWQNCEETVSASQQDLVLLKHNLEQMVDRSNSFAAHLESLKTQENELETLLQTHQALINQIDKFRNRLDHAMEER